MILLFKRLFTLLKVYNIGSQTKNYSIYVTNAPPPKCNPAKPVGLHFLYSITCACAKAIEYKKSRMRSIARSHFGGRRPAEQRDVHCKAMTYVFFSKNNI